MKKLIMYILLIFLVPIFAAADLEQDIAELAHDMTFYISGEFENTRTEGIRKMSTESCLDEKRIRKDIKKIEKISGNAQKRYLDVAEYHLERAIAYHSISDMKRAKNHLKKAENKFERGQLVVKYVVRTRYWRHSETFGNGCQGLIQIT